MLLKVICCFVCIFDNITHLFPHICHHISKNGLKLYVLCNSAKSLIASFMKF